MSDETIVFETEDGEEVELVVIDETQFNGTSYIIYHYSKIVVSYLLIKKGS